MGREARMVPEDWKHPKDATGQYKPLLRSKDHHDDWLSGADCWIGNLPDESCRMPNWPDDKRTHYMMYETTSEGTPISPAFATPEGLAWFLVDSGATAFAGATASYEAWLGVIIGNKCFVPTLVGSHDG